ncbi:LexA family protein [Pseudomonas sp. NPDC077186]|jgi:DNA polymerase V|uniref:LexA family protein n=1 Tax=Pseudomonadaceae TaxID=135621 RepID=UPI0018A7B860|nr:translesion error-prone DNA polymerase V autoproteolytic subunit [Pseudomonas hydrolytica]MBF8164550.1 translesion error-prone DNA polymerase V autoproteolytic subunit [Pseudomonas mendocina]UTH33947.1 translesion error-prone DNA polymerase V autoproteolytic subunit [Pseudomonas hydrolytica]UZZ13218.1 translesion error-prone DNA polymerase V autoproteolytic subunit [Pseudomonas mendocina]
MALTVIGRPLRPGLRLPLFLSRVAAGFPSPAEDHIEASLSLDELCVVHPAATFFLRVVGDSMTGLGIFDGDILVVDRSITPRAGMVVVAVVNGEFTCKQLAYERGAPVLRAANKAYPDIRLRDGEDLEVFGVVTRCIHKLPGF